MTAAEHVTGGRKRRREGVDQRPLVVRNKDDVDDFITADLRT